MPDIRPIMNILYDVVSHKVGDLQTKLDTMGAYISNVEPKITSLTNKVSDSALKNGGNLDGNPAFELDCIKGYGDIIQHYKVPTLVANARNSSATAQKFYQVYNSIVARPWAIRMDTESIKLFNEIVQLKCKLHTADSGRRAEISAQIAQKKSRYDNIMVQYLQLQRGTKGSAAAARRLATAAQSLDVEYRRFCRTSKKSQKILESLTKIYMHDVQNTK